MTALIRNVTHKLKLGHHSGPRDFVADFWERKVRISVRGRGIFSSQDDVNLQMNYYC